MPSFVVPSWFKIRAIRDSWMPIFVVPSWFKIRAIRVS
jgi:hypothetical protein